MPGWSVDHIAKDCDDSLARSHSRRKDFLPPSSGWPAVLFVIAVLLILTVLVEGGVR